MSRLPLAAGLLVLCLAIGMGSRYFKYDLPENADLYQERIDRFMNWLDTDFPGAPKATVRYLSFCELMAF